MGIDERAEPPEQPPTIKLDAVQVLSALIKGVTEEVKASREETSKQFDEVRRDLETVKGEGQRTNLRLTRQEVRMDDVETRLANNSMRAAQTSNVDMDHEAKIANVIVKTAALETAIHETRAIVEPIAAEIAKQSDYMGMGKKGLTWLGSKEGRNAMAQLGAAIVVLYEALKHGGVLK